MTRKSQQIINFLDSRGGFDHWWYGIDKEIQDEILADLEILLESFEVKDA